MVHRAVRVLFERGLEQLASADPSGAEQCFCEALALDPDVAELHSHLGLLQQARGDRNRAQVSFRRAIDLQPHRIEHRVNHASLLIAERRTAEAEACLRAALEIDSRSRAAWSNLGVLLASVKRDDEAERCFEAALAIDPDDRRARFNSSYLLLRRGRFDEGWAALEARDWYAGLEARLPMPRWRGEALQGRAVLVGFEAGQGDMIQFARYAAVLKARGASAVGLLCHPSLKRLFETLDGVDVLIGLDEALPPRQWDWWTPPFSIPHHCRTRLESIPAVIPYLHATSADVDRFAAKLPPRAAGEHRVGLVWQGNPKFENDAERSLPSLEVLAPLATVPEILWISLQKGVGEAQACDPAACIPLIALGAELGDFADTAAVLAQLDLVITVDTAVAHLAGALGRPCWVLLPFYRTDWRWLDERTDSPWYPVGMRLFRQSAAGRWDAVVDQVLDALRVRWAAQGAPASAGFLR